MALILSKKRIYSGKKSSEEMSNVRVVVGKEVLSSPYDLLDGIKIKGRLLKVFESMHGGYSDVSEIPSFEVEMFLFSANNNSDSIYFSKNSWAKLRDYGVLADKFFVTIEIEEVEPVEGEIIKVYPKRDVAV